MTQPAIQTWDVAKAMPVPVRIRYRIYRKGFFAGALPRNKPPAPPYRRKDYAALWQNGYRVGALVRHLAVQHEST